MPDASRSREHVTNAASLSDPSQDRSSDDAKPTTNGTNAQPLAPPPKPTQTTSTDTPDYFSSNHNSSNQFSLEPNPFERSFGQPPSGSTPNGGSILPPVASITSPSGLPGITPGWQSLRAGPLSPAMLAGPANTTDYFSGEFRGFPTPNESSLRTGLTPGGGGSMFPAPSPNSQHLFQLQSGGATPGTLDFHKTALSAATASSQNKYNTNAVSSQPPEQATQVQATQPPTTQAPVVQGQPPRQDMYQQHDVHGAANDLLQFATQANGNRNGQFAVPTQANQHINQGQRSNETSPVQRRGTKGSVGTDNTENMSESGQSEAAKPRTRGKKANNKGATGNSRRKAEDTPAKGPASKKQKGNNGMPKEEDFDSEEEDQDDQIDTHPDGKKMTDEEKRKNFLERNRVAALKCRQRKKQWLANLQAKVELFSTENDALSAQVTQLREEVVNLKTLLLAHKDCPVSQAQGLGGMNMNSFIGDIQHNQNPYGIGMHNGMMMGQPQAMQQRG
ncbi:hypothetical protein EJ05DRAFT_3974 [Pseudovirgaria hyperparasitica]|uniref:BZIP domain-containing protein n=1 Tax=Pseudovirgaria hyperparasitica TaxID=470096 RepID=A0A6A6WJC1_9PEZI|nr:uncharacterized protein EJ05DRAFT_3974 [Pseudovirgaria hyperparasitica]KAF2762509.1 hypothetical protein EJ05DRAFT_3974 [Pseudovirgaria hyperparasitica]